MPVIEGAARSSYHTRDVESNPKEPLIGNRPNYYCMKKVKLISLTIASVGIIIGETLYFYYGLKYVDVKPINYVNIALFALFASTIPSVACIFVIAVNAESNKKENNI